jgi:anti-anti-sigma regulatory factor
VRVALRGKDLDVSAQTECPDTGRLRLRALTVGFRAVVEAAGTVDGETLGRFEEVLTGHVQSCVRELWVDLSMLEAVSPHVAGVLTRARDELAGAGRELTVIGPAGAVRARLELAGVRVAPDRSSAHRAW